MTIINVDEAVELTRLSGATIRLYAQKRKIPSLKLGARLLFVKEDLEEWINAGAGQWRRSQALEGELYGVPRELFAQYLHCVRLNSFTPHIPAETAPV